MYRIKSKRDYYIYIYGLDRAGVDYKEVESSNTILVPHELATEVKIMKDQLLSEGFFSVKVGQVPSMPIKYNIISEIGEWCIYRVEDSNNEIFNGINAQMYIMEGYLVK